MLEPATTVRPKARSALLSRILSTTSDQSVSLVFPQADCSIKDIGPPVKSEGWTTSELRDLLAYHWGDRKSDDPLLINRGKLAAKRRLDTLKT
eukprot:7379711-Prymnesium_polylepis.2